jgi:hypothetical protein
MDITNYSWWYETLNKVIFENWLYYYVQAYTDLNRFFISINCYYFVNLKCVQIQLHSLILIPFFFSVQVYVLIHNFHNLTFFVSLNETLNKVIFENWLYYYVQAYTDLNRFIYDSYTCIFTLFISVLRHI